MTEELDSFQRTGRTPPEREFGGRHSTDRLPPGQDPVRGLEVGCLRNPSHEPQPFLPDVSQLHEVRSPDTHWTLSVHDRLRRATHCTNDRVRLIPILCVREYDFKVRAGAGRALACL